MSMPEKRLFALLGTTYVVTVDEHDARRTRG